jgi:hypothetical protein
LPRQAQDSHQKTLKTLKNAPKRPCLCSAVNIIGNHSQAWASTPLFLYLPFQAVHSPLQSGKKTPFVRHFMRNNDDLTKTGSGQNMGRESTQTLGACFLQRATGRSNLIWKLSVAMRIDGRTYSGQYQ